MLHAFNKGDLDTIMHLRPQWSAVKDLAEACELLQEKAILLALMEMFFRRPPNQRTVSFADIAAATKSPLDKVHHPCGLIGGSISFPTVFSFSKKTYYFILLIF